MSFFPVVLSTQCTFQLSRIIETGIDPRKTYGQAFRMQSMNVISVLDGLGRWLRYHDESRI